MQGNRQFVLSIAGFDPCAGAGILADVKTIEQLGLHAMGIITANTIQTENKFVRIEWMPLDFTLLNIQTLLSYYDIKVVKIGIVNNYHFLSSIIECIKRINNDIFIIWDPVLKSSTGFDIFSENDLPHIHNLSDRINMITPNYDEYMRLKSIFRVEDFENVLIKGGHRNEQIGTDILKQKNREFTFPPSSAIVFEKHGSGCVLSAAIATYLSKGYTVQESCLYAKNYIEQFLKSNNTLLGYHHDIQ